MASPFMLQDGYQLAMRRDGARETMPRGAVWSLIDYIPEILDARLRKRGGYVYASQDISSVQATATYLIAGVSAEYTDGQSLLVFDEDGRIYEVESVSATEDIGAGIATRSPTFYNDMVIAPDSAGAAGPKKITRSGGVHTVANLGGTPPAGRYAGAYKDVVWLGASAALPRRTYFSVAGNAESWDTTNKYLDNTFPVSGYAFLANAALIFSHQRTTRVRGSIPPPDSDFFVDDPAFMVGCTDNRSIAYWRDKAIFANAKGLYITDGTEPNDVTKLCGMKSWWRDVLAGREGFSTGAAYSPTTWSIAGGVHDDYYFYSIMNGATLVDSGMIDLTRYAWMRLANIDSTFFFERLYPEELFFARRGAARLGKLSDIFVPAVANKSDADGDAVLPVIEYPFFEGQPGVKTAQRLYLGYDVRDAASDNPTLTVSYIDSPEETSYTSLTPALAETNAYTRATVQLAIPVNGIGIKIAQSNPSSDTRLYALEADLQPRERSRGLT